jgi:hypothetical protein
MFRKVAVEIFWAGREFVSVFSGGWNSPKGDKSVDTKIAWTNVEVQIKLFRES